MVEKFNTLGFNINFLFQDIKKQPAYGADVMRLWVASTDYTSAVNIGPSVIGNLFYYYHFYLRENF